MRVATGIFLLLLSGCTRGESSSFLDYPKTATVDQVDLYHGVEIRDPYRWLEDPESPQTRSWIESQNRLTEHYLESIPLRRQIEERLKELWNFEKYDVPVQRGGRYFFRLNDGLQNQPVLYVLDRLEGEPRAVLDPNRLSEDGTVALMDFEASPDGKLLAYGLSQGGSDWREWRIRDVETGEDLVDRLQWVKFSEISWTPDSRGFYYSRYDAPRSGEERAGTNYFQKLFYHRVGTSQAEDQKVYERPDQKEWGFAGRLTEDGAYLVVEVWKGTDTRNGVFYRDLRRPDSPMVELLNQFDARYEFVGNRGNSLWFLTDLEAPRGRLVEIDLTQPAREHWKELIPEQEATLEEVHAVGGQFVAVYLEDARNRVQLWDLAGRRAGEIPLPGLGTVEGFTGSLSDGETFYSFSSFTRPASVYRYDFRRKESSEFRSPRLGFDPQDYETHQVFYSSRDGTRIPMFLSHKKGLSPTGDHPTLLFGYGGFSIPITPFFSVRNLVWMEMGGIYAVANIRGGGEYGEEWHQAGMKLNKQNVFDDFIAAAEWLIENRYTSTPRLAIHGRSNGGLLVGACLIQRPDLFGAAVPSVGVLDMLRFHRFTIGWAWVSDYGSPDQPEEFAALRAYSPYHNVRPGTAYPATFITTADHDDRVVPAHSFKFAAALQAAQEGPEPILIRIETQAGHGAGTATQKQIEESRDILSFLVRELEVPF